MHKGDICDWLITGKTYLIQKERGKGATSGNYTLITCLPGIFILLAGITTILDGSQQPNKEIIVKLIKDKIKELKLGVSLSGEVIIMIAF